MYRNLSKKIFHVIIITIIIFVILCIAGIFVLRYQVEGESNMPFDIKKISLIESVEGIETEGTKEKWNFSVNQNNDIYVYIEKNDHYSKTEIIESVKIDNIKINKTSNIGETKIYKPVTDEKRMFINSLENEANEIIYNGDLESSIKEQKISNQGGKVAFRYAINNVSQYISENDVEIDHSKLLKFTNITPEDLQTKISFDITIKLKSGKIYQTTIDLDIPSQDIIEEGTKGIEITDLQNIIFKRIEN